MKKITLILSALALIAMAGTATAGAAFGPRLGYTHDTNLDQFHFGGHAVFANITSNLHIIPSVEVGVGDGTLLGINGDVVYEFTELASGKWSFYAGGGPTLTYFTMDNYDSTDFALSLVAGLTFDVAETRELFAEARFGIEDAPALKLTLGMTFF